MFFLSEDEKDKLKKEIYEKLEQERKLQADKKIPEIPKSSFTRWISTNWNDEKFLESFFKPVWGVCSRSSRKHALSAAYLLYQVFMGIKYPEEHIKNAFISVLTYAKDKSNTAYLVPDNLINGSAEIIPIQPSDDVEVDYVHSPGYLQGLDPSKQISVEKINDEYKGITELYRELKNFNWVNNSEPEITIACDTIIDLALVRFLVLLRYTVKTQKTIDGFFVRRGVDLFKSWAPGVYEDETLVCNAPPHKKFYTNYAAPCQDYGSVWKTMCIILIGIHYHNLNQDRDSVNGMFMQSTLQVLNGWGMPLIKHFIGAKLRHNISTSDLLDVMSLSHIMHSVNTIKEFELNSVKTNMKTFPYARFLEQHTYPQFTYGNNRNACLILAMLQENMNPGSPMWTQNVNMASASAHELHLACCFARGILETLREMNRASLAPINGAN